MSPSLTTSDRHTVFEYEPTADAGVFHVAYGYVPNFKLDFLFRPVIPRGALRRGILRLHYNRIQPLIRYLEPAPGQPFGLSLGNISQRDAPRGRGALTMILSRRFPNLLDQGGRSNAAFSHGLIIPDQHWTAESVLHLLLDFAARFQREAARWYPRYHCAPPADRTILLQQYLDVFADLAPPPRLEQVPAWRLRDAASCPRVLVSYPPRTSADLLLRGAGRIAAMLFNSDIPWSDVHTGGQTSLQDTLGPRGLTVRLVREDELAPGPADRVLALAALREQSDQALADAFGLAAAPPTLVAEEVVEPLAVDPAIEWQSIPMPRLSPAELVGTPFGDLLKDPLLEGRDEQAPATPVEAREQPQAPAQGESTDPGEEPPGGARPAAEPPAEERAQESERAAAGPMTAELAPPDDLAVTPPLLPAPQAQAQATTVAMLPGDAELPTDATVVFPAPDVLRAAAAPVSGASAALPAVVSPSRAAEPLLIVAEAPPRGASASASASESSGDETRLMAMPLLPESRSKAVEAPPLSSAGHPGSNDVETRVVELPPRVSPPGRATLQPALPAQLADGNGEQRRGRSWALALLIVLGVLAAVAVWITFFSDQRPPGVAIGSGADMVAGLAQDSRGAVHLDAGAAFVAVLPNTPQDPQGKEPHRISIAAIKPRHPLSRLQPAKGGGRAARSSSTPINLPSTDPLPGGAPALEVDSPPQAASPPALSLSFREQECEKLLRRSAEIHCTSQSKFPLSTEDLDRFADFSRRFRQRVEDGTTPGEFLRGDDREPVLKLCDAIYANCKVDP